METSRTEYILSCCSIFAFGFSLLYLSLLVWSQIQQQETYVGFSLWTGIVAVVLFFGAYIANYRKHTELSLTILSTTIITICTLAGIWWGFDLPSVLLGYILSILIVAIVGDESRNKTHLLAVISMMCVGYWYRGFFEITETWHGDVFALNDIVEISIVFGIITALLMFSERSKDTLLDRAKRTEKILKNERDALEVRVKEKIDEAKALQAEHLATVYRFVEFGRLSSGLFHDLMSPIQTLKLYLESFPDETLGSEPLLQLKNMQNVSNKIEHMLETMRKQIRFNLETESFDVIQEIQDILLITKHLYMQKGIIVEVHGPISYGLETKKVILNHVLLNLISNACEACEGKDNSIYIHVVPTGGKTCISVVDTGQGIAESDLEKIFDTFYSTKKNGTNCGIGLSSSKYAVEQYLGGKLLVESEEGVGTTVSVVM
ncbi:MAG: HAMP domain-containing sensor histidine kinase [Patescibacteria group bacterium]